MKEKKHAPEDVIEIRRLYATGEWTYKKLAEKYGCSISNIGSICTGYSYMGVTGGDPVFIDGHRKLLQCGHQGINHPFHKLTEEKVMEIRRLKCEQPWLTLREIGKRYEIHESTVGAIVNNRLWKNLPSVDEIRNQ